MEDGGTLKSQMVNLFIPPAVTRCASHLHSKKPILAFLEWKRPNPLWYGINKVGDWVAAWVNK